MKKNVELKDRAEQAQQRSNIYGFLARVYRKELTSEMLAQIKDPRFKEVLSDLGVQLGDEFFSVPDNELIENLAIEYTRLFLGPGRHISPHESIHYERDDGDWGKLWGASTVEVKKFVESLGLKYKESDTSIPDHISVELELMQKVIEKEKQAWSANGGKDVLHFLKIEKMFMEDHIIKWISQFCDKVIAETEVSFYREMAELTKSFITLEMEEINRYISYTQDTISQQTNN
jgi:TorA maturation chaperone TorD